MMHEIFGMSAFVIVKNRLLLKLHTLFYERKNFPNALMIHYNIRVRRVIGISGSPIYSKSLMELIFNPVVNFDEVRRVQLAKSTLLTSTLHSGSKRKSSWKKLIPFFLSKIFLRKFVLELHVTYMFIVQSLNTLILEELPLYRGSST